MAVDALGAWRENHVLGVSEVDLMLGKREQSIVISIYKLRKLLRAQYVCIHK
jgi:hypothetical protein